MMTDPTQQPDPIDAATIGWWLDRLWPDGGEGHLSALATDPDVPTGRRVVWGTLDDLPAFAVELEQAARRGEVWLGAATRRQVLGPRRGGARDCRFVPGLWLDIDIAGPGHAETVALPRDIEAASRLAARFPLPPSVAIHTGGGVHLWWLFHEPLDLDVEEAELVLERWGATWAEHARAEGVHLDNVFDAARIMRVPGTVNRKAGAVRPVKVITSRDVRYSVDDLDQFTIDAPQADVVDMETRRKRHLPWTGPERPGDAFNALHTGSDVLRAAGWLLVKSSSEGDYWKHPEAASEWSAVVYADDGHTAIYSETAVARTPGLKLRKPYDPYGLFAAISHAGDMSAASSALRARGYGSARPDDDLEAMIDRTAPSTERPPPAEDDPWPEAQAVIPVRAVPPWPVEALPPLIAEHCLAVAEQLQVPIDLCCQQAVAVLAAVVSSHREIEVKHRWYEPLNLYLVTALASGVGKSPADRWIVGPLRDLEMDIMEESRVEAQRAALRLTKAEHEHKNVHTRWLAGSATDEEMWAAQDALDEAKRPMRSIRLLADDATPEALTGVLEEQQGRIAIVSTEAAIFDMVCGQYTQGGRPANLDVYLKGWGAETLRVDRKTSDPIFIPRATLTIGVTVQPGVLGQINGQRVLQDRGFFPRFMFAVPAVEPGDRDIDAMWDAGAVETYDAWAALVRELYGWARCDTHRLQLDAEAKVVFRQWQVEVERRKRAGGDLQPVTAWAAKLVSSVARLAGLLHAAETRSSRTPVGAGTVQRAIAVAEYWIAHALTVSLVSSDDPMAADARLVLEAVRKALRRPESDGRKVTVRAIHHAAYSRFKKVEELVPALEHLIDRGWLRLADGSRLADIGQRGRTVEVVARPDLEDLWLRVHEVKRVVAHVAVSRMDVISCSSSSECAPTREEEMPAATPATTATTPPTPSRPTIDDFFPTPDDPIGA